MNEVNRDLIGVPATLSPVFSSFMMLAASQHGRLLRKPNLENHLFSV
jgi:hypothetical protein